MTVQEWTLQDWFERRTFYAPRFDTTDLAQRKAAAGLTVSVVLPTRNEAHTIGGVIAVAQSLVGALVDEIVVVDGGSTDETVHVARDAGATVYQDSDILPEAGAGLGKGDALWRSLTITSGDIVLFLDTDIRNPASRFITGLLGPLLVEPDVQLVKAFYDRPFQVADELHPTGGGRVTELTARPLINLYWPELAGLVQPLSGEYAGRRPLLEAIPFFTGYGVELGMLIDTAAHAGVDAIAQVDLVERVHRNQSMNALSRMAFGILQVALQRLGDREATHELPTRYVQFERAGERMEALEVDVRVQERPALVSYRR